MPLFAFMMRLSWWIIEVDLLSSLSLIISNDRLIGGKFHTRKESFFNPHTCRRKAEIMTHKINIFNTINDCVRKLTQKGKRDQSVDVHQHRLPMKFNDFLSVYVWIPFFNMINEMISCKCEWNMKTKNSRNVILWQRKRQKSSILDFPHLRGQQPKIIKTFACVNGSWESGNERFLCMT